ncbi:MAG: hypothetical protein M1820_007488 [Bogoriella megaspora]|nr:MAG: hypothetical protein M1820_007488 [Bogoriella megaspora]
MDPLSIGVALALTYTSVAATRHLLEHYASPSADKAGSECHTLTTEVGALERIMAVVDTCMRNSDDCSDKPSAIHRLVRRTDDIRMQLQDFQSRFFSLKAPPQPSETNSQAEGVQANSRPICKQNFARLTRNVRDIRIQLETALVFMGVDESLVFTPKALARYSSADQSFLSRFGARFDFCPNTPRVFGLPAAGTKHSFPKTRDPCHEATKRLEDEIELDSLETEVTKDEPQATQQDPVTTRVSSPWKILPHVPTCWVIIVLGFLVVTGSLAIGLYFTIAQNRMGDGFTTAGWIVAVGTLGLAVPVAKHYPRCQCWSPNPAKGQLDGRSPRG